jgi:UDP-N-acetylglucosamine 3-dehydrogenase
MPAIRMSKQLVDQGTIGRIRTIQIQQESDYKPTQWRKYKELNGGGVFIDAGIHKIHYLRYLIGDPDYLYALTPQPFDQDDEVEDGLIFVCKWKTGPMGLIYHSWTASAIPTPHWVSISGSYGRISFNMETPKLSLETGSDLQTFVISEPLNGLLSMAKEFISSIREDREPETSGEEGLKVLEMVYKAYESAKNRTSLPFNVH